MAEGEGMSDQDHERGYDLAKGIYLRRAVEAERRVTLLEAQALAFRQRALDAEAKVARVERAVAAVDPTKSATIMLSAITTALGASDAPDGSGHPDAPHGPGDGESEAVEGANEVVDLLAALQQSIEEAKARRIARYEVTTHVGDEEGTDE